MSLDASMLGTPVVLDGAKRSSTQQEVQKALRDRRTYFRDRRVSHRTVPPIQFDRILGKTHRTRNEPKPRHGRDCRRGMRRNGREGPRSFEQKGQRGKVRRRRDHISLEPERGERFVDDADHAAGRHENMSRRNVFVERQCLADAREHVAVERARIAAVRQSLIAEQA
ncbi:hypothetical protein [Burkholderia savannae]|uniref:hypothetical protein n=1 Tax=Burkholderia savannae TaxID=1637837 RepID=UPI0012E378BF|nr:hypothetical protein [Burkholderia savannae]